MSEAVTVDVREDRVGVIEMRRPPHNFFSPELVEAIADALEGVDGDPAVRAAGGLLTGRRCSGEEATELGLADRCVPADQVRVSAIALAAEMAENAPLAVQAINRTLRAGLADRVRAATAHELAEQARLGATD